MVESLDSSFIVPSIQRAAAGGLVIVGAIEIVVPFITALTLELVSLLVMILDPAMSVSVVDDVPKITLALTAVIQSL
jgi:hypothetical protein